MESTPSTSTSSTMASLEEDSSNNLIKKLTLIDEKIDNLQEEVKNLKITTQRNNTIGRYRVQKGRRICTVKGLDESISRYESISKRIKVLKKQLKLATSTSDSPTASSSSSSSSSPSSSLFPSSPPSSSPSPTTSPKAKEREPLAEENSDLLIVPNWDTRDPKRLVAWQIERHIHWAADCAPWNSRSALHRILNVRTAAELLEGQPPGTGNESLVPEYCRVDPVDDWGKPASALLWHAKSFYKDPDGWMLMDLPRTLLIGMEAWYFKLGEKERTELSWNANEWQGMPDDVTDKWNKAFSLGRFVWE
ncbi:hypothetical protein N7454_011286 [Penicillium verhagenii]|nr:hypothetical protein N7454_011286 [Penicillium verhagenii]